MTSEAGIAFAGRGYYHRLMHTVTCKIPESLDSLLEETASQSGVGKSELIREALRQYLPQKQRRSQSGPSIHDRWQKYCGVAKSTVSDLATNAKYLADFGK